MRGFCVCTKIKFVHFIFSIYQFSGYQNFEKASMPQNYVIGRVHFLIFFYIYQRRIGTKSPFEFHNYRSVQISVISSNLKIKKIYTPSSSLLQGKYLPFSASPLRVNIFRLFVILSLTQLYRYTPEYFSFRLPHLNIPTGPPSDELDKNSQRTWLSENFSH